MNELDNDKSIFDTDETNSEYYSGRFDTQNSLVSDITGGAVAAVADFGVSVFNSLPGTEEVYTQDVLSKVSDNALRVYEENPETIETIAFIGGSFIPGGLALKGVNALRAGVKGVSWFSNAGRVSKLAQAEEAFKQGVDGTKAYRAVRRELFRDGILNNVVDAAATEVAILGTLNASPLLEDYWDDPAKNFALSLGFGGAIGGLAGGIATQFDLNKTLSAVQRSAIGEVVNDLKYAAPAEPTLGKLQILESNVRSMEKIIDPNYKADKLTKEYATQFILETKKQQDDLFNAAISPEIEALPAEVRNALKDRIANDVRISGANDVKFFTLSEAERDATIKPVKVKNSKAVDDFNPKTTVDEKTGEVKEIEDVVFLQEFNTFATVDEAQNFLRASSLGETVDSINKAAKGETGKFPNQDAVFDYLNGTAPSVDLNYLIALKDIDKLDGKALQKLVVSPDDPYVLNALVAKAKKNPEMFENATIKFTKNKANFDSFQEAAAKAGNIPARLFADLRKYADLDSPYNLARSKQLSTEAMDLLSGWLGNGFQQKQKFRSGMDAFLRGGADGKYGNEYSKVAGEIYSSTESVALRNKLKETAAKEGDDYYVYLYRGIRGKAVGHSAIESYTPLTSVAEDFGNTNLFKINVDDIIGTLRAGSMAEFEYLVGSAARPPVLNVSVGSAKEASALVGAKTSFDFNVKNMEDRLLQIKEQNINKLLQGGVPLESIAIRTNTPLKTIQAYATGLNEGETLASLTTKGEDFSLFSYGAADDIEKYLAPENRALRLKSNVNKLEFSKLSSQMDIKLGLNANTEYMEVISGSSDSFTMRQFHQLAFGTALNPNGLRPQLDMLRAGVSEFNNSQLGNSFFQSSDFFLRNTSTGRIVTKIGKDLQGLASKAAETLTVPLTDKMAKVARSEVALIEANVAMAVNASIKGPRIIRQGKFFTQEKNPTTGKLEFTKEVQWQGKPFQIISPEVNELMDTLAASGRELFQLKNGINRMQGRAAVNDLGFWVPAFNPKGKSIAYVYDTVNRETKLLWGKSEDELRENISAFRASVKPSDFENGRIQIVENKQNQELYNQLNGRLDPLTMQIANVEKFHTGSSQTAVIRSNADIFSEIIGGYENYIESHVKQLGSMLMHDTIDTLGKMSKFNTRFFDNQPLDAVQKLGTRPEDGARVVMNTLLGNSNLSTSPFWQSANDTFETYTNFGLNAVRSAFKSALEPLPAKLGGSKVNEETFKQLDYERISKELEKAGVGNPWQVFDDAAAELYGVSKIADATNSSKRAVYASNAFAATFALRVLEVAQPLVNAMSFPILTSLAKAHKHPETFMGVKLKTSQVGTAQIMLEGARLNHSAMGNKLAAEWEKLGYFDSYVSEANNALRQARSFEGTFTSKVENALDSSLVRMLSKPSDVTESIVRRQAMFTGAALAKRLYPELDDAGVTVFARDFLDRSVGNYHAPQRPIFYQGTMGVALGLFQTYMLTMGQNIYRHLELKNYKALGKAALTQSAIFGTASMPGFDMVSEAIGDNFSDDNIDLTTGTFKALGDPVATATLYGLPSSLGPAFYTRGDLQPRGVNPLSGPQNLAAANLVGQAASFGIELGKAISNAGSPEGARNIAQAFALQSVSRPLARASEIVSGYSITQAGNTVATPEDIYTTTGIISRLLSVRPVEEAKAREAIHLNTVYGQLDREHRQKVTKELKTAIRNGTLDDAKISTLAEEYYRKKGTPSGWRSAVNTAIAESKLNGKAKLLDKLKPDNPLMYMLEDLDGE